MFPVAGTIDLMYDPATCNTTPPDVAPDHDAYVAAASTHDNALPDVFDGTYAVPLKRATTYDTADTTATACDTTGNTIVTYDVATVAVNNDDPPTVCPYDTAARHSVLYDQASHVPADSALAAKRSMSAKRRQREYSQREDLTNSMYCASDAGTSSYETVGTPSVATPPDVYPVRS